LGTIIHETLKSLYDPFVGRFISESDIQNCFQIDDEVLKQFKVVYKDQEIGIYWLLSGKRNVSNFLKVEMESIKAIRILALEQTLCIFGIDKKE
jgi:hypothetical protein